MNKDLDFSHQDIRGLSFKKQDLTGANFEAANIRSTDFTNAILRGANFSKAKAGLQQQRVIFLLIIALFLALLSGFVSSIAGAWVGYLLSSVVNDKVAGIIIIISYLFFIATIIHEGLQAFLKALGIAGGIAVILIIAGEVAGNISLPITVMAGWAGFVLGTLASVVTLLIILALITSTTVFVIWAGAIAGGMALGVTVIITTVTSVFSTITINTIAGIGSLSVALVMGGLSTCVTAYIGWQVFAKEEKYTLFREIAIAFAAIGGTSFHSADLTDANFTSAMLKSTNFTKANLTRTCWNKSKKLDRVRPGTTYLKNAQVRQLLSTKQGQNQNFDGFDLRGVNLQAAELQDASFIGANLNEANLQDANLSGAQLVKTQIDQADFTGATLTGACIEDWGITRETKLEGVRCEYVYMRLPTKEKPNPLRKPDNEEEVFADGDFGNFIQPIFDTLDLYHNQQVDPRAIAISWKRLTENYPEADLRMAAMEVKSENQFLLRIKTAEDANKSELSAEYFNDYNQFKGLSEREFQLLLAEKYSRMDSRMDSRMSEIENMVKTALEQPKVSIGSVGGDFIHVQGDGNRVVQGDHNVIGYENQITQQ